jgi:phenylpropionate dioxygenase-like ring-hydroxylating dioxygenase large terminal subunit
MGAPEQTATPDRQPAGRPARYRSRDSGRQDWSSWPHYLAAADGLRGYWYPVSWASKVTGRPRAVTVCGEKITLIRDRGTAYALRDRCPHRGVPLSLGRQEFPGTLSCPYHGWTFDVGTGLLRAAITDGPDSPICGKVAVETYPVEERLGMVWVYLGDGERAHPIDEQIPEELRENAFVMGGRIEERPGNWRFACENGFDEGHAKYLHRNSLWRLFKTMPTWNTTKIVRGGRWIYRVQQEVHWKATFPGLGEWTNYRWWKARPPAAAFNIGNTGRPKKVDPVIAAQEFPGFASLSLPGVLRIAYPNFIHYEFYVPIDGDRHRYVGVMVNFRRGWRALWFYVKYLAAVRWLFHGQFSGQDAWMVDVTDAPPERLYRPDSSLVAWRRLCEEVTPAHDAGRARRPRLPDPLRPARWR